ncbi:MAG: hypothetical protein HY816_10990 [Candidatus Wallbacteria bacterium]|nr:hypothetical protein [Candidatus Wallbacteria bacterium]
MYRNILLGIILGLTVLLLILIFLLGNQWYYESQGDEQFRSAKYDDAAGSFIKSYGEAKFLGQGRLLYKIGLAYQNNRDFDRSRDYYFELVRLYPDSPYSRLAAIRIEECYKSETSLDKTLLPTSYAAGSVEVARQKYVRAYQNLSRLLLANRSGVTPELEAAYQAYKIFHVEYKRQLALALDKFRSEHPDFVWPPPGAETGPDPVSVDATAPSSPVSRKDDGGRREPELKLSIPEPPRVESKPSDIERELSGDRRVAPTGAPGP